MHPEVTAADRTAPSGMNVPRARGRRAARRGHEHGDGLEWEDLMPEINRVSDSANMIWQLIDRQTGAVNGESAGRSPSATG